MALPMNSVQFKSIVEPILNDPFDGIFKQATPQWSKFVKESRGTPRRYHEEPVLYGLTAAPEMPEGTPVVYGQGGTFFIKQYIYKVFGLGYALTRVLIDDGDAINLGKVFAESLAQAMIETKETRCANLLNRAFTPGFIGGDGVTLASASHPLATGGTYSNLLTAAALSQTSLEQACIQIAMAVNFQGKKITLEPKQIIVSPQNYLQAEVILKSVIRTGTGNNDINPLMSAKLLSGGYTMVSRLTSATAWFVQTNATRGLQLKTRKKLERSMEGDFETDSMRYKATERYIESWTDPHGVWCNAGL